MALVRQIVRLSSIVMSIQPQPDPTNDPQRFEQWQEILVCIENLSVALASVLLYPSTHERIITGNGLEEIIRICKITSEPLILQSLAKILVTMVPHPRELAVSTEEISFPLVTKLFCLLCRYFIKIRTSTLLRN